MHTHSLARAFTDCLLNARAFNQWQWRLSWNLEQKWNFENKLIFWSDGVSSIVQWGSHCLLHALGNITVFIVHPCMMSLMPANKTITCTNTGFFLLINWTIFSESYVPFMSCDVIETMLYCIQTIYCKGSSETAHMCKLVWVLTVNWLMMYMYMYDHWTELSFIRNPVGYRARKEYNLHLSEKACLIF